MGIKNLISFLKLKTPGFSTELSLSEFKHKKIAIDSPGLLYKFKYSSVNKKDWVNSLVYFFVNLIKNNIDPIVVLEGFAPPQKKNTQLKRKETKDKLTTRNLYLQSLVDTYKQTGVLNPEIYEEWEKLKLKGDFNFESFEKKVKQRDIYTDNITAEDHEVFKQILSTFYITTIKSNTEAETLCAQLLVENKVDFIFSNDSDLLAYYGVEGYIHNIDFLNKKVHFYNKKIILDNFSFTEDQFVKFCILCGTDYNTTPKNFGITSAFNVVKSQSIDTKMDLDSEDLNYCWVKSLFYLENREESVNVELDFVDFDEAKFNIIVDLYSLIIFDKTRSLIKSVYKY